MEDFEESRPVDAARVQTSIAQIRQMVDHPDTLPLIEALSALACDPADASCLAHCRLRFAELGILQGAVLTYAPYLVELMSGEAYDRL